MQYVVMNHDCGNYFVRDLLFDKSVVDGDPVLCPICGAELEEQHIIRSFECDNSYYTVRRKLMDKYNFGVWRVSASHKVIW